MLTFPPSRSFLTSNYKLSSCSSAAAGFQSSSGSLCPAVGARWSRDPCPARPHHSSRVRCPIPAFPAIQARKSFHCWEQIGQDTGIAPAFPPASCPLPLGLRVGAEPWGGDGGTRDRVRWGGQGQCGCSGQRPGKPRVCEALSPHCLPLTYNTAGSPRHKVIMSADTDCHLLPRLWPPPCYCTGLFLPQ